MVKADTGPKPPKLGRKPSKKEQYERFVETARKLGADESEEAFEATFARIVPAKKPKDVL